MGSLIENIIRTIKLLDEGTTSAVMGVPDKRAVGKADGLHTKKFKSIMQKLGYEILTGKEKHGTGKETE